MSGTTFVYVDYGASPDIGLELRYSLATLLAEAPLAKALVYTDKPDFYAQLHPAVTPRPLGVDLARWTREGAFNHRIKICALADTLKLRGGLCVLLDTDSYIAPGFAAKLLETSAVGPVMDHFERRDPFPEWAGWGADLPGGRYVYDSSLAVMHNSGLVAVRAGRDEAALADAVALVDALYDSGRRIFLLEQFAFSETLRRTGRPIGEMAPEFHHYFRRSLKRYLHWRLRARERRIPGFAPTRPCVAHPRNAVRAYNLVSRLFWRY